MCVCACVRVCVWQVVKSQVILVTTQKNKFLARLSTGGRKWLEYGNGVVPLQLQGSRYIHTYIHTCCKYFDLIVGMVVHLQVTHLNVCCHGYRSCGHNVLSDVFS